MRRFIFDVCLLVLLPIWLLVCAAHAQYQSFPPGVFGRAAIDGAGGGGGAYTGVGDIVGFNTYWALRAYTSANRGSRFANICIPADAACADLSTDAVTGKAVFTTIGGSSCSSVTCTVKILYDQTLQNNCNSASVPCDLSQATISSRPTINTSCINGLPCMVCNGSASIDNATFPTIDQPYFVTGVAERTSSVTSYSDYLGSGTGPTQALFNNAANQVIMYAGALSNPVTATDGKFHSIQSMFNSASSILYVDGGSNTVNASNNSWSSDIQMCNGNNPLTGNVVEVGFKNADLSANNAAINSNQTAFWGPF